jgi:predicted DNA binding CopG/RHH family protein
MTVDRFDQESSCSKPSADAWGGGRIRAVRIGAMDDKKVWRYVEEISRSKNREASRRLAARRRPDRIRLVGHEKVRFELARKDASISLRLPAALRAAEEKMPTQRFIRILIEAQLSRELVKAKREPAGKTPRAATRSRNRAA